jgi:hypothetical protein
MDIEMQQTKIIGGVQVHYPKGKRLTIGREQAIERSIIALEESFGQKVWKVWCEPDKNGTMPYYSIIFTFDRRPFVEKPKTNDNWVIDDGY